MTRNLALTARLDPRTPLARLLARGALTAALVAPLVGCGKPERPTPQGPGVQAKAKAKTLEQLPTPKVAAGSSALSPEQRSIPLATIGKRVITLGELEARLQQQPEPIRAQYRTLAKRKEFLLKWVQFEVLAEEARKQGLDKDPTVVETLKQQMVRRLMQESVTGTVRAQDITEAEVKAYYDNNQRLYHKPLQVEIRHILLKDGKRAERVRRELQAGAQGSPAKLAALWKDYVQRVSEDKGSVPFLGTLGMVSAEPPKGATPAELERWKSIPKNLRDAGLKLEAYTLSEVLQSEHGYHILYAVSRSPAVDKPFDKVKRSIRQRLLKRKRDLARTSYVDKLMGAAKVEYKDDAIRLLPPPKPVRRKPTKADLHVKPGGGGHGHAH